MKNMKAFTLVELIVVIVILAILGTLGFVSLQGYTVNARDSVRISDTKTYSKALNLFDVKHSQLPMPDDATEITGSGNTLSYQGTLSGSVITSLGQGSVPLDPQLKTPYVYAVDESHRGYQLLTYLEKPLSFELGNSQAYAADDLSLLFPHVTGDKVGIVLDENNNSLSGATFNLYTNTDTLTAYYADDDTLSFSGYTLLGLMNARLNSYNIGDCPEGYIFVPGNPEFHTNDFCVAQYEMSYPDADDAMLFGTGGTTSDGTDWNTVKYIPGKQVVSMNDRYPIADINQGDAIAACNAIGPGYHLITNNEWMTLARNIESVAHNWSSGVVGDGSFHVGVYAKWEGACDHRNILPNTHPSSRTFGYKTGLLSNLAADHACNTEKTYTLSNNEVVWDLAGNVWEHVNKANTYDGTGYNSEALIISGASNSSGWDDDGVYAQSDMEKYGPATFLGLSAKLGTIHGAGVGNVNNPLMRGGDGSLYQRTGIYTIELGVPNGYSKQYGFRCAKTY